MSALPSTGVVSLHCPAWPQPDQSANLLCLGIPVTPSPSSSPSSCTQSHLREPQTLFPYVAVLCSIPWIAWEVSLSKFLTLAFNTCPEATFLSKFSLIINPLAPSSLNQPALARLNPVPVPCSSSNPLSGMPFTLFALWAGMWPSSKALTCHRQGLRVHPQHRQNNSSAKP